MNKSAEQIRVEKVIATVDMVMSRPEWGRLDAQPIKNNEEAKALLEYYHMLTEWAASDKKKEEEGALPWPSLN